MAWVTPDDAPGSEICVKVWLPSGIDYEACLKGALLSLAEADNWEQVTGQTAEVVAQAFSDANEKTLEWRYCMPIGAIIFGGWSLVPDGFLECDGASYATDDYPALFAEIGYTFGGSGANFLVPKLDKRLAAGRGLGTVLGQYYGQSTVTLLETHMPSHIHTLNSVIGLGAGAGPLPIFAFSATPLVPTNSTGGNTPHNNVPPSLGLVAAISYE